MKSDIADIYELSFPDIEIQDSDSIICCLKVGWKFLLYFDFLSQGRKCTAYGFLDHSLKEDCATITISLKGVSNGKTQKIHP